MEIKALNGNVIYTIDADTLECANLSNICLIGANLIGANLTNANLSNADLSGADLWGANLSGANLSYANLSDSILNCANLSNAILHRAYLFQANLCNSNLNGADLTNANMENALMCYCSLRYAILCATNLDGVNLMNSDMKFANLNSTNISKANLAKVDFNETVFEHVLHDTGTAFFDLQCPEEGSFIGFKKVRPYWIVKLLIPEDAKRSSATTRKCRCSKAKVLSIYNMCEKSLTTDKIINTDSPHKTIYKVGEMVYPDSWDDNRWNECSHGIHFFITELEAIIY
jgi:hypothetical protein